MTTNNSTQKTFKPPVIGFDGVYEFLGLKYPQGMKEEQKQYWDNFFYELAWGYKKEVIDPEDILEFEKGFYKVPDEEKMEYLSKLREDIKTTSEVKTNSLIQIREEYREEKIKRILNQVDAPDGIKHAFKYVIYTVLAGEEPDPKVIEILQEYYSPEVQEALAEYKLNKTFDQIRRNPLDARKLEGYDNTNQKRVYNQALSGNQLAEIIERHEQQMADKGVNYPYPQNNQRQPNSSAQNQNSSLNTNYSSQNQQKQINKPQRSEPTSKQTQKPNYNRASATPKVQIQNSVNLVNPTVANTQNNSQPIRSQRNKGLDELLDQ